MAKEMQFSCVDGAQVHPPRLCSPHAGTHLDFGSLTMTWKVSLISLLCNNEMLPCASTHPLLAPAVTRAAWFCKGNATLYSHVDEVYPLPPTLTGAHQGPGCPALSTAAKGNTPNECGVQSCCMRDPQPYVRLTWVRPHARSTCSWTRLHTTRRG